MHTLEQLKASPEYWVETNQNIVFRAVLDYQTKNDMDKAQLAVALGCTPRMTTQLLNGSFNCSMSKLFDIITRMGLCPVLELTPLDVEMKKST